MDSNDGSFYCYHELSSMAERPPGSDLAIHYITLFPCFVALFGL